MVLNKSTADSLEDMPHNGQYSSGYIRVKAKPYNDGHNPVKFFDGIFQ